MEEGFDGLFDFSIASKARSGEILLQSRKQMKVPGWELFFCSHQKSLVYETPVATGVDITAGIVVASADITNTLDLFERVKQFFAGRCQLCWDLRCRNALSISYTKPIVVAFLTSNCDALFVL
ncbi:hypothetical protein TNCV_1274781 [Trichonephila clavipes]|nr:hypothetical protein TNCV_1274781 [Trichonephila clavipes]